MGSGKRDVLGTRRVGDDGEMGGCVCVLGEVTVRVCVRVCVNEGLLLLTEFDFGVYVTDTVTGDLYDVDEAYE